MSLPKGASKFWKDPVTFRREHKADILAIKALYEGVANETQQKRALSFIIKYLCRADEINFYESDRDTCFALGRAAVGTVLRGLSLDSDWIDGENL